MPGICHAYELIKYIYVLRKLKYIWGNISFNISFQIKTFYVDKNISSIEADFHRWSMVSYTFCPQSVLPEWSHK